MVKSVLLCLHRQFKFKVSNTACDVRWSFVIYNLKFVIHNLKFKASWLVKINRRMIFIGYSQLPFRHLLEAFEGEHFALPWFLWIQKHSTVLSKFGLSDTNHQRGRQTRSNRSQVSQAQACQIQRGKNVSWNFEAATAFKVLLISQFLFFVINPVKSI